MIQFIQTQLLEATGATQIRNVELIQNLWSGYGQLSRVSLDNGSAIVKLIKFPNQSAHPRGWSTEIGHQRKKRSYEIETHWYRNFNSAKIGSKFPKHIGSGYCGEYQYLILEDLLDLSFQPKTSAVWKDVKKCLSWLAYFHKSNLNLSLQGLWPIGTYWHLETRPEELEALTDQRLKIAAPQIDLRLNRAKFKTIVHGDAKLSNFLFNEKAAAAVDFQYVGGGVGVKDLAYFLSSIYREEDLENKENSCLDFYFEKLDLPEVEAEWRELYPYAWCDFYRFLQGWSPGHRKINAYSEKMKERVLQCL